MRLAGDLAQYSDNPVIVGTMEIRTLAAPALALAMALGGPTPAKTEVTPAEQVVAAYSISKCAMEYGHDYEMGKTLFVIGVKDLTSRAVKNIMANPSFHPRVANYIEADGGCGPIFNMLRQAATDQAEKMGL